MQRRARVELQHVADAERERERVRRLFDETLAAQPHVLGARDLERALVLAAEPCGDNLVRDVGAEVGREPLPLTREQPVTLKIAKRAVVGDDLEPVRQRLEAAARTMAAVLAVADELAHELRALLGRERGDRAQRRFLTGRRRFVEQRGEQFLFRAVCAQQTYRWRGRGGRLLLEAEARRHRVGSGAALAQELDPAPAAVLAWNTHDEARDDLLQLLEQHHPVRVRFCKRVRE